MARDKSFLGEFGNAIMQIADEKGIERSKVLSVVEAALAAAYKKQYGKRGQNIRAEFDEKTGETKFFLLKEVVDESVRDFSEPGAEEDKRRSRSEEVKCECEEGSCVCEKEQHLPRFNPERDITLEEARKEKEDAKVGDVIEFPLPAKSDFGRVAAQTAKQVVIQRVREAEREAMFDEYKEREGEVVAGTVERIEGRTVFVDIGKAVGVLFPSEQVRSERYTQGMRLKVYILRVSEDTRGPGITLSRTHTELVRRLFELEVPEIFAGTVELKAIAREAGSRSKIAVYTDDESIDPIGSCVGQRGTRVQAVIDELGGEKIDIIEWDEDPAKFIAAALSPARVLTVELNEEEKTAKVTVPEDQLSLAIGRKGQNVRLAVKLTGWDIDVVSNTPAGEGEEAKVEEGSEEDGQTTEESVEEEVSSEETSESSENKESEETENDEKAADEAESKNKDEEGDEEVAGGGGEDKEKSPAPAPSPLPA